MSTDDLEAGPLLVMFICNHCPYVKPVRRDLAALGWITPDAIDIVCSVAGEQKPAVGSSIEWKPGKTRLTG